jgi:hypothetical protein
MRQTLLYAVACRLNKQQCRDGNGGLSTVPHEQHPCPFTPTGRARFVHRMLLASSIPLSNILPDMRKHVPIQQARGSHGTAGLLCQPILQRVRTGPIKMRQYSLVPGLFFINR